MALVVGIQHLRDGVEPQAVLGADMSVLGIVGTAPSADAQLFPLNTPVEVRTNDTTLRAALGASGTIVDALAGISAQLTQTGAAKCVVVRVTEGETAAATIVNLVGSEANGTGIWALLDAPEDLGITPRIVIVPGFTSQQLQGIADPVIANAGTDGTDGTFALSFSGGTGSGAAGTFTVTDGSITAVAITNPGTYTIAPTLTFTASAGLTSASVTVSLEALANAVCAAIPTVLERLDAVFIPEGPTNTRQAALDWLETLPTSMRILHPLRQDARVLDDDGDVVTKPLSPYIAALYVRTDSETDGVPTRSAANQGVYGLVGVTPKIPLDIRDESSLGQTDAEQGFGIVFRGDTGDEGSLTNGGYVFWGTDTRSEDSQWLFANVVRMRDYIEIMQVRAIKRYLGKFNITYQTVQAIINTMSTQLRRLQADNYILGFKLGFDEDANTPENLRLGILDLMFMAEEPPVLRKVILRSRRHREALEDLARSISLQLNTVVAA